MNEILNLFLCSFETYMQYDLFRSECEKRSNKVWITASVCCMLTLLIFFTNRMGIPILNVGLGIFMCSVFGKIVFDTSYISVVRISILYVIISAGGEVVGELILSGIYQLESLKLMENKQHLVLFVAMEKLLIFMILKAIQFASGRKKVIISNQLFYSFLVLPISTFLMLLGMMQYEFYNQMTYSQKLILGSGSLLLLFANAFMYFLIRRLAISTEKLVKLDLLETKSVIEQMHYKDLEEIEAKYQMFRHDLGKYFRSMGMVLKTGQTNKAMELLENMDAQLQEIYGKQYCTDAIINGILCDGVNRAKKQNIMIEIEMDKTVILDHLEEVDKIGLFANILDNALEAAEKCQNSKWITVSINKFNDRFIIIVVKNSYLEKPCMSKGALLTSKTDSGKHGIGTVKIKAVAEKYGGMFKIDVDEENKIFGVQVAIPVKK